MKSESTDVVSPIMNQQMKELSSYIQLMIGYSQDLKQNAVIDNPTFKNYMKRVEEKYITSMQKAYDEGKEKITNRIIQKLLDRTADCSGYRNRSARFIACREYNQSLLQVINSLNDKLPTIKNKKLINEKEFVKNAKKVRKSFDEEGQI